MGVDNSGWNAGPMSIPTKERRWLPISYIEFLLDMGMAVQPGNTHVYSRQGIGMAYRKPSPFLGRNRHGYGGPARQYPCLFRPRNRHGLLKAISVPW